VRFGLATRRFPICDDRQVGARPGSPWRTHQYGVGEAAIEESVRCIAYNGRSLMMGYASNKAVVDEPFIVPRRVALGNFKPCAVLLADAPAETSDLVMDAMDWKLRIG
jgi:hypothetical protein